MNNLDVIQSRLDQAMVEAEPQAQRFTFYTASQLRTRPPMAWRVQGILPATGLATIFGASGTGKSFLLLDLMAAIAEGHEWYGHKAEPCRVLCIVLEGQAGFVQRIRAWEKYNGRPYPEKVSFMMDRFGLNAKGDVADMEAAIQASEGFNMIVIDTLNRAAPNADENSSSAMSQLITAAGKLQAAVSGLVILVHHTGKDESRGLRGHSSLFAAMDAAIEVRRLGADRGWRLLKSKDGKDGDEYSFKLTEVDLGEDEQGPSSSCVIEPLGEGGNAFEGGAEVRPKTPNQKAVLARINLMLESATEDEHDVLSEETPRIKIQDVIEQTRGELTEDSKRHPERARAAIDWLVKNQLVQREGDWLWMA